MHVWDRYYRECKISRKLLNLHKKISKEISLFRILMQFSNKSVIFQSRPRVFSSQVSFGASFSGCITRNIANFNPRRLDGKPAEENCEFLKQEFVKEASHLYYLDKLEGTTYTSLKDAWNSTTRYVNFYLNETRNAPKVCFLLWFMISESITNANVSVIGGLLIGQCKIPSLSYMNWEKN